MVLALMVADSVYKSHGYDATLTSGVEGKHSETSLHYAGGAGDLRINDLPQGVAPVIAADLGEALGEDFDVVLEETHIHIEFQPRQLT
tara:strand:+ start:38543 stop:38806 length:264 start_codon:yes stop_codon:yes gene_type:complete